MTIRIPAGWCVAVAALLGGAAAGIATAAPAPFTLRGPGVRPEDFRVTTFASGLSHPLGMAQLPDGSLLVAVSKGGSYWNSVGEVIRLVDADGDGVADGPGQVLITGLPGSQTSLCVGGTLVLVTGQGSGKPITVLRMGSSPGDPLTRVGAIRLNYPTGGWLHPHSALALRPTPGMPGGFDLLFQLGSQFNIAPTTRNVTLAPDGIPGAEGTLLGDSIYRLTLTDGPAGVTASRLTRIARGLRNAAGMAFDPDTGDLYLEDNGIDGLSDANEPTSADELNRIPAEAIGGAVEHFGFPDHYTTYRTGVLVGGGAIQPLIAFQPLPDPATGSESEGPNDIALAPRGFPPGLNRGVFIGFHGRFGSGGLANEENPLVYADPATGQYFHFIGNDEAGVGHLDGLLATADSLFLADLAPQGSLGTSGGTGVIYQLKSLVPSALQFRRMGEELELTWSAGVLQSAGELPGTWTDVGQAVSPHRITAEQAPRFYRLR